MENGPCSKYPRVVHQHGLCYKATDPKGPKASKCIRDAALNDALRQRKSKDDVYLSTELLALGWGEASKKDQSCNPNGGKWLPGTKGELSGPILGTFPICGVAAQPPCHENRPRLEQRCCYSASSPTFQQQHAAAWTLNTTGTNDSNWSCTVYGQGVKVLPCKGLECLTLMSGPAEPR